MKKLTFILSILALIFATACNSLDDINKEIDAMDNPVVGDAEYTLTDEDYDALDLSYGSFNSEDDAKTMLPSFLSDMYPVWGKGSSVLVGYKLYVGSAPGVSDYTYADDYSLANDDYPQASIGAVAFFPDEDPAEYLADILAANVEGAAEGDNILVKYKQYIGTPVSGVANIYEENFNGSLGAWEVKNILGSKDWYASSYGADEYAKASMYGDGVNEDWLISPEIDLSSKSNLQFQLNQAAAFVKGEWQLLNVLVSTNYTTGGDQTAATWDTITFSTMPTGDDYDYTFVLTEDYDFSAYEGEKIHIAFKYETTEDVAPTWEINDVFIKSPGVEGETMSKEIFYAYNGEEWEPSEGVYFISDADFDAMGEEYGRPGYYNNFSSSISPDDYLPTFMATNYPYGQEDDELILIYDYYSSSSGAQLRGSLYTFTGGEWTVYASTQDRTLQFAHDGSVWVPDNTIKYTLASADYDYIVANFGEKYPTETANMDSYGNFNGFSWTDDMILEVVGAVLKNNFPSAAEGQKFAATYSIYDGSTHDETIYVILSGGEYVSQE